MSASPERHDIAIEQASAGMVLAAPVLDGHGQVLLPQGATLSEATLASLRRRGIAHCTVVGAAAPPDPAELARRQARLQQLFRHSGEHTANAALLRLLTEYRSRE